MSPRHIFHHVIRILLSKSELFIVNSNHENQMFSCNRIFECWHFKASLNSIAVGSHSQNGYYKKTRRSYPETKVQSVKRIREDKIKMLLNNMAFPVAPLLPGRKTKKIHLMLLKFIVKTPTYQNRNIRKVEQSLVKVIYINAW